MTIDLDLSEDQRQIVDAVTEVLSDRFPLARFRDARGGEVDTDALAEIAALGWLGLSMDEDMGGAGFSLVEDVLLFRASGRHLLTPNVLANALGAHLAAALGETDLAARFIDGSARASVGHLLSGPVGAGPHTHAVYDAGASDFVLFWDAGSATCIPSADLADLASAPCTDKTVSLRRARIPSAGARVLAGEAGRRFARRADLLVAAQQLGLAEGALDLAVGYAGVREQFGRPIGAFQAIKHRCADMKVRTRVLGALIALASLSEAGERPDAEAQVAAAALLAPRHARENAAAGVQIHGAMGFTAECDAHLFLLRSHLLRHLGATAEARETAMAQMPLGIV